MSTPQDPAAAGFTLLDRQDAADLATYVSRARTVDPQAAVLWTAGTRMDVRVDTGGIGSLVRGGTGETFQMAFSGNGHVVVQPAENVEHARSGSSGGGGGLGDLFN